MSFIGTLDVSEAIKTELLQINLSNLRNLKNNDSKANLMDSFMSGKTRIATEKFNSNVNIKSCDCNASFQ
jgi:hypothetical protein